MGAKGQQRVVDAAHENWVRVLGTGEHERQVHPGGLQKGRQGSRGESVGRQGQGQAAGKVKAARCSTRGWSRCGSLTNPKTK